MITFTRAYVVSINGKDQVFASLQEAQSAELSSLLGYETPVADTIITHADKVIAILTLNDASRPRARGQKKPRRKAQDEQLPLVKENAA